MRKFPDYVISCDYGENGCRKGCNTVEAAFKLLKLTTQHRKNHSWSRNKKKNCDLHWNFTTLVQTLASFHRSYLWGKLVTLQANIF